MCYYVFVCVLPAKAIPEKTYTVLGGTLDPTHSLTPWYEKFTVRLWIEAGLCFCMQVGGVCNSSSGSSRVIPCQINQNLWSFTPEHLRIFHKNYDMHWNVSLAYVQNFSFLSCIFAQMMSFLQGWYQPVRVSHSIFQRLQTRVSQPFVGQMCSYFACCIVCLNIMLFLPSIEKNEQQNYTAAKLQIRFQNVMTGKSCGQSWSPVNCLHCAAWSIFQLPVVFKWQKLVVTEYTFTVLMQLNWNLELSLSLHS